MAYIEISVSGISSRFEDSDAKFIKILSGYMEDNIKPNIEPITKPFKDLTKQEQLNLTLKYIIDQIISEAKTRVGNKTRREQEINISNIIKDLDPTIKVSVLK